jgi:CubicO group peptidase (beta-lactamase class C family)
MTRLAAFGFSGTVLVAEAGKIVLHKGYGWANVDAGIPNSTQTIFDVASLTKQFTAAAILKLEMQHRLKTSDRLGKFFANVPRDKAGVAIHHLLTHTSGLAGGPLPVMNLTREQFVEGILHTALAARPGRKYAYSNAGYALLAAIIEIVTQQPYEKFLTEQLFEPAGMVATGFYEDSLKWSPELVAHGYNEFIDNGAPTSRPPAYGCRGAYFVLTSVGDLFKWEVALRGNTILSESAKRKLFAVQTPTDERGVFYGYGWKIEETHRHTRLISHGGMHPDGFNCLFQRYPYDDVVVIAAANKIFGGFLPMATLRRDLAGIIFGRLYTLPPDFVKLDSILLQKYAGVYELPSGATFNVTAENDRLKFIAEGQEAIDVLAAADRWQRQAYAELNARSFNILERARQGDFSGFAQKRSERLRLDQIKAFFNQLWQGLEQRYGACKFEKVLGSLAAPTTTTTMLRLDFERGTEIRRCLWNKNSLSFMLPAPLPLLSTWFAPQSPTEFLGFHPGIARIIRADFQLTDGGLVTGLVIHDENRKILARRKFVIVENPHVPAVSDEHVEEGTSQ